MINPRNVLMIVNSSVAQSAADANWYATTRGLRWINGGYHQLHFNFGTANSVSVDDLETKVKCRNVGQHFNKSVTRAIADYVNLNDIDAIFLSTFCPVRVTGLPSADNASFNNTASLAPFLALSGDQIYPSVLPVANRGTSPAGYTAQRTSGLGYKASIAEKLAGLQGPQFSRHKVSGYSRPWGRIGMPQPDTSASVLTPTVGEAPAPPGGTLSLMQRCVLDAMWGESQNHSAKPHLVGGTDGLEEEAGLPDFLVDFAHDRGIPILSWGDSWGTGTLGWTDDGMGGRYFQSGTLNPPLAPFGMVFASSSTYDGFQTTPRVSPSNWAPLRGSWVFHLSGGAGGRAIGQDAIALGSCAAVFGYWGSDVSGFPRTVDVLYGLVEGRLSVSEAVFFSRNMAAARCEVVGDPLYVPYKNTAFTAATTSIVAPTSPTIPVTTAPDPNPQIDTSPEVPPPTPPAVNVPSSFNTIRGNTINLSTYVTFAGTATAVSYAITAGSLPSGVTLNTTSGVITIGGTAAYVITSGLRFTVTDSAGQSTQSGVFSIAVQEVVTPPPTGIRWQDGIANPYEVLLGPGETFDLKTLFVGSTTGFTRAIINDETPLATLNVTEANDGVLTGGVTMPAGSVEIQVYGDDQPMINYGEALEANNYPDDEWMPHDGPLSGVSGLGWAGRLSTNQDWRINGLNGVYDAIPYYDTGTTQGGLTPPLSGGRWGSFTYTAPNASTGLQPGTKVNIDVTALVKGWVGGNFSNAGFWLKQTGGSARQSFATRSYAELSGIPKKPSQGGTLNPEFYPTLTITGTYNKTLPCLSDSSINSIGQGGTPIGDEPTMVAIGNAGAILYFSIAEIPNAAAVTTATLTLTVCRQYRPSDMQVFLGTGTFTLDVFRARHPFRKTPEFPLPALQTGIAWNYARDKGLENHPDIIFCERFDNTIYNNSGVQVSTIPDFRSAHWLRFRVSNDESLANEVITSRPLAGAGDVITGDDTQHPGHSMQALFPGMKSMRALWEGFNDGRFTDDRVDRDISTVQPTKNWTYTWNNNATTSVAGTTVTLGNGIPATVNHPQASGSDVWQPVYVEAGTGTTLPSPLVAKNSGSNWYYANNISARVLNTAGTAETAPRGRTLTLHETIGGPPISIAKGTFTIIPVGDGRVDVPNIITLPRKLPHTAYFPNTRVGSPVFKPVYVEGVLNGLTPRTPFTDTGSYFADNISADGTQFTLHSEPFGPALQFPVQPGPITVSGFRERATSPWACQPKLTGGGLATAPWTTDIRLSTWEEMNWRMLYFTPTDWNADVDAMKNVTGGFDGRWDSMNTQGMGVGNSGAVADGMAGWSIRGHNEFCGYPDFRQDTPMFRNKTAFGTYTYCNTLWSHDGGFDIFPWPGTVTVGNPEGTWGGGTSNFGSGLTFIDWGAGITEFGKWYCFEARCKINTVRPNDEPVYIGDGVVNDYTCVIDGATVTCPTGYACYNPKHANPAFGGTGAGAYPDTFRSRHGLPATWTNGRATYSETANSILDPGGKHFWTGSSAGRFATDLSKTDKAFRRAVIERLPTRGNYDGEYEIWVNGRQVQLRVGYMMRHVEWVKNRVNGNLVPFAINYPFFTAQVGGNNRCFRTTYTYASFLAITGTPTGSLAAHPRAAYIGQMRNVASLP